MRIGKGGIVGVKGRRMISIHKYKRIAEANNVSQDLSDMFFLNINA